MYEKVYVTGAATRLLALQFIFLTRSPGIVVHVAEAESGDSHSGDEEAD